MIIAIVPACLIRSAFFDLSRRYFNYARIQNKLNITSLVFTLVSYIYRKRCFELTAISMSTFGKTIHRAHLWDEARDRLMSAWFRSLSLLFSCPMMGDRLTVGLRTLTPPIQVRILVPQPINTPLRSALMGVLSMNSVWSISRRTVEQPERTVCHFVFLRTMSGFRGY